MIFAMILATTLITNIIAQSHDGLESCDSKLLKECRDMVPRNMTSVPKSEKELDNFCTIYNRAMSCTKKFMERCVPDNGKPYIKRLMKGSESLTGLLCVNNSGDFRRTFLHETRCWARVSDAWGSCINEFEAVSTRLSNRYPNQLISSLPELCCAHYAYLQCVDILGQRCTVAGSTMLNDMAWMLSKETTSCPDFKPETCAASAPMAGGLATLIGLALMLPTYYL